MTEKIVGVLCVIGSAVVITWVVALVLMDIFSFFS
jgi:hypothetical protein